MCPWQQNQSIFYLPVSQFLLDNFQAVSVNKLRYFVFFKNIYSNATQNVFFLAKICEDLSLKKVFSS